jgi:hypothetical protein
MRTINPHIMPHPKYSDDPKRQKSMEDGVNAMTASILELCATVIHKRMTQFAEVLVETMEQK